MSSYASFPPSHFNPPPHPFSLLCSFPSLFGCVTHTLTLVPARHSDFLRGLPTSSIATLSAEALSDPSTLSPADRVRLIHDYITSPIADGGLGIVPESKDWGRVEGLIALHDNEFNDMWIRNWTRKQIGFGIGTVELDKIKEQVRRFIL